MKEFTHFCLYERQRIERYLKQKQSRRYIATKLDRSVSSVSDEVNENSVGKSYCAIEADRKAYMKRNRSKRQCLKVTQDPELKRFVVYSMLRDDQSPEGISGRLKHVEKCFQYASAKAIYNFVRSPAGRQIERHLYSNSFKTRTGNKRGSSVAIDGRITIDQRPKSVGNRLEFGHFEGDFIESGKDGKGSLLVLVERKTRYPFLRYLDDRSALSVNRAVEKMLHGLPVKSFTIDNDISFQKHEALSEILQATVFFCHPHCPHEKGTVENRNKAVRRYVKKKCDLSKLDPAIFFETERKLRDRFMECLDYKTPREAFNIELVKQKHTLTRGMLREKLLT
jgi:IS30 family transposase